MAQLLTATQMRAHERAEIDGGRVTGLALMECAGRGVVEAMLAEWPELAEAPHRALVVCGPGNNGGDGFVIARLLIDRGWSVEVVLMGDAGKLPPDAKANCERWEGPITALSDAGMPERDVEPDIVVDALFGTGLVRPVEGRARLAVNAINAARDEGADIVAVDVPSGLCSDSGRVLGAAVRADLTVSFHTAKPGHFLAEGPTLSGKLRVHDIGLPMQLIEGAVAQLGAPPWLGKASDDHKYGHGHALILSGGMGRSGAARLAARGALRVGAGLVTVAAPGSAMMECACQLTAIMLRKCDDADGLSDILADERLNALCLGPGMGAERARALLPTALGGGGVKPRPTVLDADVLTAYADAPEALFAMLHEACVLTPHDGEFARLFPDAARRLREEPRSGPAYSRGDAAREASARAGCTILLKGPDTVIATPGGSCAIHASAYDRAAPWLATAGSGDVLAGIITGLMARGIPPQFAACAGPWLHTEAALGFGPGLIAEDLPDMLPGVFRALNY